MKTLIIVRHAKTKQANFGEADFDRTLTDRGRLHAPEMAKQLKKLGFVPQGYLSSPAKRTLQTARLFCNVFDVDKDKVKTYDDLYNAPYTVYYAAAASLKDKWDTVAIFGHNPGITDFVNTLCKDVRIDDMPTGSVFVVEADITKWKDFAAADKKYRIFLMPKKD